MNDKTIPPGFKVPDALKSSALALALALAWPLGLAQPAAAVTVQSPAEASASGSGTRVAAPCTTIVKADQAVVTMGKSTLIRLPGQAERVLVGGLPSGYAGKPIDIDDDANTNTLMDRSSARARPQAAARGGVADVDVMLLSPSELYLLGKSIGTMNVILQARDGQCTLMDIAVVMDSAALQAHFGDLLPDEKNIRVSAAADSLILSGQVSDAVKVARAMTLAAVYAPQEKIVNMLRTSAPQQVMLEVKVAEISKTLLDRLGAEFRLSRSHGDWTYSVLANFLSTSGGFLGAVKNANNMVTVDGEKQDGVVRILAEPNLMAISGQQASFLSGGKIFIPVASSQGGLGIPTITLEEKEFGVGLKFTPTVLDGGRIQLKVTPEVSELSQTGTVLSTFEGGPTSILPSFTTRRADTTVQLRDGQSFAIAGLIKNNLTEAVNKYPVLGEIPILGVLFRSSEFQKDMTELLFIITPHLVKPLPANYALPTDGFSEPTRKDFFLQGRMEGEAPSPQPASGGLEMK